MKSALPCGDLCALNARNEGRTMELNVREGSRTMRMYEGGWRAGEGRLKVCEKSRTRTMKTNEREGVGAKAVR